MSGEQLSRMQQVNRFLEHNLKENGELLSSLATLYEEQRAARARNTQLEEQLGSLAAAPSASASADYKAMLGKYLRADSYRKVSEVISAANRLIGEIVQSRRRPLLGPSPG